MKLGMVTWESIRMSKIALDLGTEVADFMVELDSQTRLEKLLKYQR